MRALRQSLLLCTALSVFALPVARAELQDLRADGWHVWKVAASGSASQICCYSWQGGGSRRCGCDLDGRREGFKTTDDVVSNSGDLRIYVRTEGGKVRDIKPLSAGCPVTSESELLDLDPVSARESIEWLSSRVRSGSRLADNAILAISLHADGGVDRLIRFVEDRTMDKDLRETTLFWLAHSDTDQAFAYLDELLTR